MGRARQATGVVDRRVVDENVRPPSVAAPEHLGVAIAGGGVRATLFAAGGLLALSERVIRARIVAVTSVSGGSVTNAHVAIRCRIRVTPTVDLEAHLKPLVERSVRGIVPRWVVGLFVVVAFMALALGAAAMVFIGGWLGWVVALVGLVATMGALLFRGRLLVVLLEQDLLVADEVEHGRATADSWPTLASMENFTAHVLCATELSSGQPIYFSGLKPYIATPMWGASTTAGDYRLADAVGASNAFPVAFPPKRLRPAKFDFQTSGYAGLRMMDTSIFQPGDRQPTWLRLADGGLWNNLATDWYADDTPMHQTGYSGAFRRPDALIVIDGSAPPKVKRRRIGLFIPGWTEVDAVRRSLDVLYTSTVEARSEALRVAGVVSGRTTLRGELHPLTLSSSTARLVAPVTLWTAWESMATTAAAPPADHDPTDERSRKSVAPTPFKAIATSEQKNWFIAWPKGSKSDRSAFAFGEWRCLEAGQLHRATSRVKTTFLGMDAVTAFLLLLHGHLATREAIFELHEVFRSRLPDPAALAGLVGLRTVDFEVGGFGRMTVVSSDGRAPTREVGLAMAAFCEGIRLKERTNRIRGPLRPGTLEEAIQEVEFGKRLLAREFEDMTPEDRKARINELTDMGEDSPPGSTH